MFIKQCTSFSQFSLNSKWSLSISLANPLEQALFLMALQALSLPWKKQVVSVWYATPIHSFSPTVGEAVPLPYLLSQYWTQKETSCRTLPLSILPHVVRLCQSSQSSKATRTEANPLGRLLRKKWGNWHVHQPLFFLRRRWEEQGLFWTIGHCSGGRDAIQILLTLPSLISHSPRVEESFRCFWVFKRTCQLLLN